MLKMSLRNTLLGMFAVIFLCVAINGYTTYVGLTALRGTSRDLGQNWMPSISTARDVLPSVYQLRNTFGAYMRATAVEERDNLKKAVDAKLAAVQPKLKAYEANISEPGEKEQYAKFQETWGKLTSMISNNLTDTTPVVKMKSDTQLNIFDNYLTFIEENFAAIVKVNAVGADKSVADGEAEASRTILEVLGFIGLTMLMVCAAIVVVLKRLAAPMAGTTEAMSRLAAGDLESPIPYVGRSDEIGEMAAAIQIFRDNAIRVKALEEEERQTAAGRMARAQAMSDVVEAVGQVVARAAEGDFSGRVEIAQQDASLRKLIEGINQINSVVDNATGELVTVLGALAEGDLTRTIASDYRGRLAELKDAVNATTARLSDTVVTIQATAREVSSSAVEIKSGANDLAQRTEQQASSLEETAATTEELAASVKSTAQSSRQVVTEAQQAQSVAQEGGAIVAKAVEAMSRIEQTSTKISDITTVIEEIAFQTNLLALNAAVEAARAGDAGKGFAVVAAEVRTLAQRSSDAAKNIGGLINSSTAEVGQGVALVRNAGEVLGRIVTASGRVAATVGDISTACGEQANGIDEMSQVVAHMDEITQQNAALAEQSSASATALGGQIEKLNALVAQFRTDGAAASAAPANEPRRLRQLASAAAASIRRMVA